MLFVADAHTRIKFLNLHSQTVLASLNLDSFGNFGIFGNC